MSMRIVSAMFWHSPPDALWSLRARQFWCAIFWRYWRNYCAGFDRTAPGL